ncbi:cytochrome BD ubiquinol oxidase subunit I [Williamsia sp. Leaf354]|uniref:cytochrome ubiquinol oxidase subunit I n=1 Tax=Williamsia sp. Leaf354 TaxID=1736349 RepID=UPI0006F349D5|nr:cytochrome ubiquinol oxidase subunit I [Williamsia sp. Leaf354]KQS00499.1 cytochrome BD ubiquinol oxidase subunit I [Williamsia sp. Leaf354]
MNALDISRWQFGITTVYHFILVPLTIGLAPMIAVMQTVWTVTGNEQWYRATKFFGKLFLINFALGIATGIVQEFQFGMNWSEYSRYVGDVFGAPLALEGLVAFFLESTFLGLWIFGWQRLPKKVHLACIWLVAIGVNASAYFIIAANSWMQHPVGARINPETKRPELTDFWAVMTNNTTLAAFPHAVAGSFLTAGTFVAGIGLWWMIRNRRRAAATSDVELADTLDRDARTLYRPVTRFALWVIVVSGVALAITGDVQGKLMFEQQPMKMASAESLCHTETGASFSVLTIGTHNNCDSITRVIELPNLTSFLATNTFDATLPGVAEMQQHYAETVGPGDYRPNLFVTYWAFRAMIGWAGGSALLALAGLWFTRKGRVPDARWLGRLAIAAIPTPFLANSSGWVFTEMGRQPWVVVPNPTGDPGIHLTVAQGVSANSVGAVLTSLITFTVIYGVLAVVWFGLIRRYVIEGPLDHDAHPPGTDDDTHDDSADHPASERLSFAY